MPPDIQTALPTKTRVDVVTSTDQLATLERAWNELLEASCAPNVFLTWEWVTTWLGTIAGDAHLRVVVVRDPATHAILGLAPFVLQSGPGMGPALWRELVFAGSTVSAPDHLTCLARSGSEESVAEAVAGWLEAPPRGREWDLVRLDGFSPDAPLVRALRGAAKPSAVAAWPVPCPFIPLPATWAAYDEGLDKRFRRNTRRRLRKLERESRGPVSFETAREGSTLEEAYADLVRLHAAARNEKGEEGAFRSDIRRSFYRRVVHALARRGWVRLHRLTVDGDAIAAALCFVYGAKTWCYQLGYQPAAAPYGPGYLIMRHAIRSAIAEGSFELDLLRGDHAYKYEWNAEARSILKLRVGTTRSGRVVAPVTQWLRGAKEVWKERQGRH